MDRTYKENEKHKFTFADGDKIFLDINQWSAIKIGHPSSCFTIDANAWSEPYSKTKSCASLTSGVEISTILRGEKQEFDTKLEFKKSIIKKKRKIEGPLGPTPLLTWGMTPKKYICINNAQS